MKLDTIAPRLARARDQMNETERVLGWMRDKSWTGGFYVLVPIPNWPLNAVGYKWVSVDRVTTGATPYPIKGTIDDLDARISGQRAFWEVAGIRFLTDDWPELFEIHAESTSGPLPHSPIHQPWGITDPPCSEMESRRLRDQIEDKTLEEINRMIRPGPIRSQNPLGEMWIKP